jgi:PTH1 family peptidyl-tRNA hydrolase
MCVDLLSNRHDIRLDDKRKHAALGQGFLDGRSVILAKPRTYMNASGIAVRYLVQRFGVAPGSLLVVIDDMDLPLGKIRLRTAGGSGGHNGLNSITAELDTPDYPRLRIGIGRPGSGAIEHVLGPFRRDEEDILAETLSKAAEVVEACILEGVQEAMNRFN